MNLQSLGEIAMVCLFAMKLREESYDVEAGGYRLSLQKAAEDSVAASLEDRPPEVQKAVSGLVYLMITSWNDTEMWSQNILSLMLNLNSQKEIPNETVTYQDSSLRPDAELHQSE